MRFKTILAIFIATIIVVFSLQNAEVTSINFFIWQLSASRIIIILGSFGIGVFTGILVSAKRRFVNTKKF